MIARFDSVAAFVDYAVANADTKTYDGNGKAWDGGVSSDKAIRLASAGDPSIVADVNADVDAFAYASNEETRRAYVRDVAGSRVDVPAFLSGSPTCMRRRAKRTSETRHVSIYVSLVCAAGIAASTMLARGKAILGLLSVLQTQGIACDLYLISDMNGSTACANKAGKMPPVSDEWDMTNDGDCTFVIRVESRPLDLGVSGFAIAHPAFTRHLTYSAGHLFGFYGHWSRTFTNSGGMGRSYDRYMSQLRAKLQASPTDIFVPPVNLYDEIVTDPKAWIRARVAQALAPVQDTTEVQL